MAHLIPIPRPQGTPRTSGAGCPETTNCPAAGPQRWATTRPPVARSAQADPHDPAAPSAAQRLPWATRASPSERDDLHQVDELVDGQARLIEDSRERLRFEHSTGVYRDRHDASRRVRVPEMMVAAATPTTWKPALRRARTRSRPVMRGRRLKWRRPPVRSLLRHRLREVAARVWPGPEGAP